MLNALKTLFNQSDKEINSPSDKQLKLAAATLMFELIRSDGHVDDVEMTQMEDILRSEFKLNDNDVQALLLLAKESAEEAISLHQFTRDICEHWGAEQRQKLLEYLWILALADQHVDDNERHLVRKIAGLLYLNENQIQVARQNAKIKIETLT